MSLLIACLVIYGFDLNAWLYAVAAVVWLTRLAVMWWLSLNLVAEGVRRSAR